MKVVKPLRLSLIHRVFQHQKKCVLVSTVAYAFPFAHPKAPVSETEMWKVAASALGRFGVLDFWMFKPQAEVLVTGACHTGEREKGSDFVRLVVSAGDRKVVDKTLYVFGDRRWTLIGPSEPKMFTKMPVDYAHAFGGEKYPKNPIGKGLATALDPSGQEIHPLPNIEDPKQTIKDKGDRPIPASLSAWDLTWPVHFEKKMGTYDAKWVERNGFALADDIDFGLFNVAPPDQRIPEFFSGDESIRIENMHPGQRVLETQLPGFRGRCFLSRKGSSELEEIGLRTDTIQLFPEHALAVVFMRGTTEITTPDASDVTVLMAALDDAAEPRSLEHYRSVLALRSDKTKGALYALRDTDLMPGSADNSNSGGVKIGDPLEGALHLEGHLQRNQHRRALIEYDRMRANMIAQGVEESKIPEAPAPPAPTGPANLEEVATIVEQTEAARSEAEAKVEAVRVEQESLLESICREHNIDLAAAKKQAKQDGAGPPKFTAQGEIDRLSAIAQQIEAEGQDASKLHEQISDPNIRAQLLNAERALFEKYRLLAHTQDEPAQMQPADSARAREELTAGAVGLPHGRRDFTGADLRGINLAGANLEGILLESANLEGANLSGTKLKDAVLAKANLKGANLSQADLSRANLGNAQLVGADCSGVRLTDAILHGADLEGANFKRADLSKANTMELRCVRTDFSDATAENLFFYKCDLEGAVFRGATMKTCVFIECKAVRIDATGSNFSQSVFLMSDGEACSFKDSNLENFRIINSALPRSDFSGCQMPGSNLRGANLESSNFSRTNLRRSDVSAANLQGANFDRAVLVECVLVETNFEGATLIGANMMLAIMHRAVMRSADASDSNLFCADLTGAVGDKKTSFAGANVKRALVAGVFNG